MTVLNDREIRTRCTAPTGSVLISNWDRRNVYQDGGSFYEPETGLSFPVADYMSMHKFTEEELKKLDFKPMIEPFVADQVKTREIFTDVRSRPKQPDGMPGGLDIEVAEEKIISYGLSSFGYDLRLGHKFKIFTNVNSRMVDPKNFDDMTFVDFEVEKDGDEIIIPPNSFILGYSLEYLTIPRDVVGIVVGKSTIARCGIDCLVTPLEPEWQGHVTLEFSNTTPLPAKLYAGEGCCQVVFHKGNPCEVSYADRKGKYMGQCADVVTAKV